MFFLKDKDMENKLKAHDARIFVLEDHKRQCEQMHVDSIEHRKRADDALNNLTESNMVLAKSINEMNITITEILPTLTRAKDNFTTVDNVKSAAIWIAAVAAGLAGLAAVIKFLIP